MAEASLMKAIEVEGGKGPPEALRLAEIPRAEPREGQILIRVTAAGVNRPDIIQRLGFYPPPPGAPGTMGLEVAGEVVVAAGRWNAGDRVCALLGGGGYAEFAACDARHALPVPKGLSDVEAASLPETVFTCYANIFEGGRLSAGETLMVHGATSGIGVMAVQMGKAAGAKVIATGRGRAKADETLLVHGGSSGIGTTAIQLAKQFGAKVFVTAGSDEKCEACRKLGADLAINYKTEDFVANAKKATDGKGVDLILDMVGGDYIERNYEAAAVEGRIVQIAFQGSPKATVDFRRIMLKRLHHTGSTLRSRSTADKAAIARAVEDKVLPLLADGRVKPVLYKTFPLKDAAAAHALMESSAHIGKIVLAV